MWRFGADCVCGDLANASARRLAVLITLTLHDFNSFPGIKSNFELNFI